MSRLTLGQAKAAIRALRPGSATYIRHESEQPAARISYQMVNSGAYKLWGAGSYKLRSVEPGLTELRRLA